MTRIRFILAAALVAALVAVPASAQSDSARLIESQEQLIGEQQTLIDQQQTLIDDQEALLNTYRCKFDIDTQLVSDGCPSGLTEEETADGALLCAGWLAEREKTERITSRFSALVIVLEEDIISTDNERFKRATRQADVYLARTAAIVPSLSSERLTALFTEMVDAIEAVIDARDRGASADEMAAAISASLDQLHELDAAIAEICS